MSLISEQAFIGEGVTLGEGVTVGPFAVILGPCEIGDGVWIGPGAHIGAPPEISSLSQNAAWAGKLDHAGVVIGPGAVVREAAVIHQGSYRATTIGAESWILNRVYLAHDVLIGDRSTVSAGVSIGGHCVIGDGVNLGMNASVHQRRVIASGAMVGMGTPVTADVPPFAKVYGSPARLTGVNEVGMERSGFSRSTIDALIARYVSGDLLMAQQGHAQNPADLVELAEHLAWWERSQPAKPMKVHNQ